MLETPDPHADLPGEGTDGNDLNSESGEQLPFQVTVRSGSETEVPSEEIEFEEDPLSLEEIEAAYQRALETAELADSLISEQLAEAMGPSSELSCDGSAECDSKPASPEVSETGESFSDDSTSEQLESDSAPESEPDDEPLVNSRQVVEAMLFVGGPPLPVKKFLDVLGGTYSHEQVEELLQSINDHYASQNRPYEVRLVEGGYCLKLLPEYEAVRNRVYGHGPKEVKLTQDALEVLAFIAYQQPVTKEDLAGTEKQNVAAIVRQLLRRELIQLERLPEQASEQYRTTPRFLELFGLSSIEDLPQTGTFQFR